MSFLQLLSIDSTTFLKWLLTTSISACIIAGAIVLMQTLFARWLTPAGRQRLWLLLVIRLLLPVLPSSPMSIANIPFAKLLPLAKPASSAIIEKPTEADILATNHIVRSDHSMPIVANSEVAKQPWWTTYWPAAVAVTWLLITAVLLARLVLLNASLGRRLSSARVVDDPQTLTALRDATREAGLRSIPSLVISDAVSTPAVDGILQPRIVLPLGLLQSLTPVQLRHVLLHELAHIRHRDVLGNWVIATLGIVHWFNPLIHMAMSRLKADREMARDAWVIERIGRTSGSTSPTDYSNTLIDLAQRLSSRGVLPLPSLFGRETTLKRRLQMICRVSNARRGSRIAGAVVFALLAGGLLTGASAQQKPDASQDASTAHPRPSAQEQQKADQLQLPLDKRKADSAHTRLALDKVVPSVSFDAVGLTDVLNFLQDVGGVTFEVNWKRLHDAAISENTPVTCKLHNIRLGKALNVILEASGGSTNPKLGYAVQGQLVLISTIDGLQQDNHLSAENPQTPMSPQQLAKLVQQESKIIPDFKIAKGTSFNDAINLLREISGANLVVDWKAIEAAGISRNAPVSCELHNVKFGTALDVVLSAASAGQKTRLDYVLDGDAFVVDTVEVLKTVPRWRGNAGSAQPITAMAPPPASQPKPENRNNDEKLLQEDAQKFIDAKDIDHAMYKIERILEINSKNEFATTTRPKLIEELKKQDPAKTRQSLDRVVPMVKFDAIALNDVVMFLRDISGQHIEVDWNALKTAGVDPSTLVSANVNNIKFSQALDAIFDGSGAKEKLGYAVQGKVIVISTKAALAK